MISVSPQFREAIMSGEQAKRLARQLLDRLNEPARHDLDDVAREFGIDLDDDDA